MLFGKSIKAMQLQRRIQNAHSYDEWHSAVQSLERYAYSRLIMRLNIRLNGTDKWKLEDETTEYDYELVRHRLVQMQTAREMNNPEAVAFLLRTSLTRNFAGTANPRLFMKSQLGTKKLIEDFHEEIVTQLRMLSEGVDSLRGHVEIKNKLDYFRNLRKVLGNTALLLSGGGALGVYHIGVLQAIVDGGMLPRIIAGSSSGAIIAAMLCTRHDDEHPGLMRLEGINYNFIEPPMEKSSVHGDVLRKLRRWFRTGVIFDPEHIMGVLQENLGDMTFLEAYQKTRRILNIAVSSSTSYEMPNMLNYITAPNVLIWSAVQASCALPLCFPPVTIMAKNAYDMIVPWQEGTQWIDGSVENDIPMKRLAELFNVNHFIVCQVNPHIYPFVSLSPKEHLFGILYEKGFTLFMSEIQYRLQQLHNTGYFRKLSYYLLNIIKQPYQGDITIVPQLAWRDYLTMFSDLKREGVDKALIRGLHAAWPKLAMIKNQCMIEAVLDDVMRRLQDKEQELMGKRMSTESLLDAIQDTANVLSCTPLLHASIDDLVEDSSDLEEILRESSPLPMSLADSLILQDDDSIPPEFSKPRVRSRSMTFNRPETIESGEELT